MRRQRPTKEEDQARRRVWLSFGIVACAFGVAAANQIRVQWLGRDRILKNAIAVRKLDSARYLMAQRGSIFSSDDKTLARTSDGVRFGVNPKDLPRNPAMFLEVAEATGLPAALMFEQAFRKGRVMEWNLELSSSQVDAIETIKRKYGADGLWCVSTGERDYPMEDDAASVVGFVENRVGRAGVEQSRDTQLRGEDGVQIGMTDGSGQFLPWTIKTSQSRPKADGSDITLTIDSDIQRCTMELLKATCERNKPHTGIAIAMDPKTGDILSLATWPTFDPKDVQKARLRTKEQNTPSPELNPAVASSFEPGSTFKLFTVAEALQDGVVTDGSTVYCDGDKQFSIKKISCAHGASHGAVTPQKCIEQSCNVAAATWATQIGFDRYYSLIRRMRILNPLDLGLPRNTKGQFRLNDGSKLIQMANVGFGQSINVTPLRLASAFTAFANRGLMSEPRLIKKIGQSETPRAAQAQVFNPTVAEKVLHMMETCVQSPEGTGHSLRVPGFTLAGKTGTAQKLGSAQGEKYVSSFVGFVPSKSPRALILVMIDSPSQGAYYGADVAGPVFKGLSKFILQKFNVKPDRPQELGVAVR